MDNKHFKIKYIFKYIYIYAYLNVYTQYRQRVYLIMSSLTQVLKQHVAF